MQLVDDGLMPGDARWAVVSPGKGRINDRSQRGVWGAVPVIKSEVGLRVAQRVGKECIGPAYVAANRFRIGIEHKLVGIEAVPLLWLKGATDAVAIELAREDLGQIGMPDL